MNILICDWNNGRVDYLAAAKKIEEQGHKIVYWVGSATGAALTHCRELFPRTIFHNYLEAMRCQPAPEFKDEKFPPPDEKMIKDLYETESILSTLKQYEKLDMSGFEKSSFYHSHIEYWLGVINKLKPEVVIFALYPHTGYDYILFSVAKYLKIKTLIFQYMAIADRNILINDFTVGSPALRAEVARNRGQQFKINDLSPDIKEFFENQISTITDVITNGYQVLKNQYDGFNLLGRKLKIVSSSLLDLSIFKKFFNFLFKKIGPNYKKEYEKFQTTPDFNKKFVYLALHYQPEGATAPLGGIFVDQHLMIKMVSWAIPDDWLIYVKEHPYQWFSQGLNYTRTRYPGYYESIAKIDKVRIVPMETKSSALINSSRLVATITGSVAWEAVLRSKPALVFGYFFFRDCPGIFKVQDVSSCQAALSEINFGYTIKRQEIINYLISLDRLSFHAFFDRAMEKFSKLSPEDHADNIAKAVLKEIGNK